MRYYIYVKDLMLKFTIKNSYIPVPSLLTFKLTNHPIEIRQTSIVPNYEQQNTTIFNIEIPNSAIYSSVMSDNNKQIKFDKNKLYEEFTQNILDVNNWQILIPCELQCDNNIKYNTIELDESMCSIDILVTEKEDPYLFSISNILSQSNTIISPEEQMSHNMSYLYEIKDDIVNNFGIIAFINTCIIVEYMHTNKIIIDIKEIVNIENELQPDTTLIKYLDKYNISVPINRLYQTYNNFHIFSIDKFSHSQTSDIVYDDDDYYEDNDDDYYYYDCDDEDDGFYESNSNEKYDDYYPKIVLALHKNNRDIVEEAISNGLDVHHKYEDGRYIIHYACMYNAIDIVKLLIDNNVDINVRDNNGWTPLIYSSQLPELYQLLIEKGADVNIRDIFGKTVFSYACQDNDIKLAQLLIDNGATTNDNDSNNWEGLRESVYYKHFDISKLLIQMYSKLDSKNIWKIFKSSLNNGYPLHIIQLIIKEGLDIVIHDEYGKTAIMYACENDRYDVAKVLAELGARVDTKDDNYKYVIDYCQTENLKDLIKLHLMIQNQQ